MEGVKSIPIVQAVVIEEILVSQRIRREAGRIEELADDIRENGLLNPITVMRQDGDAFRLLAGFRRLKACEMLEWDGIPAVLASPQDAESALLIEISENIQREPLTFSEKMEYGGLLEEIEVAKAKERMAMGGKGGVGDNAQEEGCVLGRNLVAGRASDTVGKKLGMSGRTYERAKYIAVNAPPEIISQLNSGERGIRTVYEELRVLEKETDSEHITDIIFEINRDESVVGATNVTDDADVNHDDLNVDGNEADEHNEILSFDEEYNHDEECEIDNDDENSHTHTPPISPQEEYLNPSPSRIPRPLSKEDEVAAQRIAEFNRLPAEDKVIALKEEIYQERGRAAKAESALSRERDLHNNTKLHGDSKIESLRTQLADAIAKHSEMVNICNELRSELEAVKSSKPAKSSTARNTCRWERKEENGSLFVCDNDKCGFEWDIEDCNSPHELGIKYCPGCGRDIVSSAPPTQDE